MADTDIRFVDIPAGETFTYDGFEHTGVESGDDYTRSGAITKTNAGTYTVTVVLNDHTKTFWADGTIGDKEIEWTILPKQVLIPSHDAKTYNGTRQIGVADHELYELHGTTAATDVGSYTVTGVLRDKDNTRWVSDFEQEGTVDDQDLSWEIKPATITKATAPGLTYTGSELQPEVSVSAGNLTATFDLGSWSPNPVRDVGTYTATITGNGNFTGELTVACEVFPKIIAFPVAKTGLVYDGKRKTGVPEGDGYTITGNTGIEAQEYVAEASLIDDKNTCWPTGGTGSKMVLWRISRRVVMIPQAHSWMYTGDTHYGVLGCGFFFDCSGTNTATDPGDYTVTVELQSDDYEWSDGTVEPKRLEWRIARHVIPVPTAESVTPYSSQVQVGVKAGEGYEFVYGVGGVNEAVHAGDYVAVVVPKTGYLWPDWTKDPKEIPWSIKKAKPVVGRKLAWWGTYGVVVGESRGWHFDGGKILNPNRMTGITLKWDTDWGSLKGTKLKVSESGDKSVTITITGDSRGGKPEDYEPLETTGTLTVTRLVFEKPEAEIGLVYTGKLLEGVHGDPSEEGYTVSGNTATAAGNYTATASLKDKDNFAWADSGGHAGSTSDISVPWTIAPATITEASARSAVYTGAVITPEVTVLADNLDVTAHCDVTDWSPSELREPGRYTGTAKPKKGEGNVTGSAKVTFTIDRAAPSGSPKLTITYGDKLGGRESEITGEMKVGDQVVAGTFAFRALEAEKVPHVSESENAFAAVFTPDDTARYVPVDVGVVVTVERRDLWVRAANDVISYGEDKPTFIIGSAIGLYGSDTLAVLHGTPVFSCAYNKGSDAGLYAITIDVSAVTADDYTVRPDNNGTLTVKGIPITLRPKDVEKEYGYSYTFGPTDFDVVYGALFEGDSIDSVTLESDGAAADALYRSDPYRIYPSAAVFSVADHASHYDITYVPGKLTVEQKKITIRANDRSKECGTEAVFSGTEFSVTEGNLVNGDAIDRVTLSAPCAPASSSCTDCLITPSFALGKGIGNYEITYDTGILTTGKCTPVKKSEFVLELAYGDTLKDGQPGTDWLMRCEGREHAVTGTFEPVNPNYKPMVSESGTEFDFRFYPSDTEKYNSADVTVKVVVSRRKVAVPEAISNLRYDGTEKTGIVENDALYTLSGHKETNAGNYVAIASLKDVENYCWDGSDDDVAPKQVDWVILKRQPIFAGDGYAELVHGQRLLDAVIYGIMVDVGGVLSWADPERQVLCTESGLSFAVRFTPTDIRNVESATTAAKVTVTKRAVTVTAVSCGKFHKDSDPTLGAVVSGVLPGDTVTYSVTRAAGEDTGTYAITASGAAEQGCYTVTFTSGTFTISCRDGAVKRKACLDSHAVWTEADCSCACAGSAADCTASKGTWVTDGCYCNCSGTGRVQSADRLTCRCAADASSCTPAQTWVEKDCACVCVAVDGKTEKQQKEDCERDGIHRWDHDLCACKCILEFSCSSGEWSDTTCDCGPCADPGDCECYFDQGSCGCVSRGSSCYAKESHGIRVPGVVGDDCVCAPLCNVWDACTTYDGRQGHYNPRCECVVCQPGSPCSIVDGEDICTGFYDMNCVCARPPCDLGKSRRTPCSPCECDNREAQERLCEVDGPNAADHWFNPDTCGCECRGSLVTACRESGGSMSYYDLDCECSSCRDGKTQSKDKKTCECANGSQKSRACEASPSSGNWLPNSCSCDCSGQPRKHERGGVCVCIGDEDGALALACAKSGGKWDADTCECGCAAVSAKKEQSADKRTCVCKNAPERKACTAYLPEGSHTWSEDDCSCRCNDETGKAGCGTGNDAGVHYWDLGSCSCKCFAEAYRAACETSGGEWDVEGYPCKCKCASGIVDDAGACVCGSDAAARKSRCELSNGTWVPARCDCDCGSDKTKQEDGSCKCNDETGRAACEAKESGGRWNFYGHNCACDCDEVKGKHLDGGICVCDSAEKEKPCKDSYGKWKKETCSCDCSDEEHGQRTSVDDVCVCVDETVRKNACEASDSGGTWIPELCTCDCGGDFHREATEASGWKCACPDQKLADNCTYTNGSWDMMSCKCTCGAGQTLQKDGTCKCDNEAKIRTKCESETSGGTFNAYGHPCACSCELAPGDKIEQDGECVCFNRGSRQDICETENSGGKWRDKDCTCDCSEVEGKHASAIADYCICDTVETDFFPCTDIPSLGTWNPVDCKCDCPEHKVEKEDKHECECDIVDDFVFAEKKKCLDASFLGTHIFNDETCTCDCDIPDVKLVKTACESAPSMGKWDSDPELPCTCDCSEMEYKMPSEDMKTCVCIDRDAKVTECAQGNPPGRWSDKYCVCCRVPDYDKAGCYVSDGDWDDEKCECDCTASGKRQRDDKMTCGCEADEAAEKVLKDACEADIPGQPKRSWDPALCECGCRTEPGTPDARAKADCDEALAQGVEVVWNKKTCTCDCVDTRRTLRQYIPVTSTEDEKWGCFCDKDEWEESICGERYKDGIHQFSEAGCDCPCGPLRQKSKKECEETHKLDPDKVWFEDDCSCGCWNRDQAKDCKRPKRWFKSQCRCGCAANEKEVAEKCAKQSGGGYTYSWHQDKCACACVGDKKTKCWTKPNEHLGEDPGDGTIQENCSCKCDKTNYPCQVLDEKGYHSDGTQDEKDGKHGVLRDGAMNTNCDCMCESVFDADGNRTAKGEPCWYMWTDPVSGQKFRLEGKVWSDCSCVCKDAGMSCQTDTIAYGRVDPGTCECVCAPDGTPCEHLDGGQGVVRTNPDTGVCECICDYENEYQKCSEKAATENFVEPYTYWKWNDTACRCDCATADLECTTDDGNAGFVNAKTCKCEPCNKVTGVDCVEPTSLDELTCRCDCSEYEEQYGTCLEEKGSMGYRRDPDQNCECVCEWDEDTCAVKSAAVTEIYGDGLYLEFIPGDCACRCNKAGEACVDELTEQHGHYDEETCQCVCRADKERKKCEEKATETGMPWVFDEELCECVCSDKEEDKCTTEDGQKVSRSEQCKCECDTERSCNSPYGEWLETDDKGNLACRCDCLDRDDKLLADILYGQKDWWEVDDTCHWDCVADPHAGECRDKYGDNATASKDICDCQCAATACSGATPDQKPLEEGCECFCDEAKRVASCPKDANGDPMFDKDNCKCSECTAEQKGDPSEHDPRCEEWEEKTCKWVRSYEYNAKKDVALGNAERELERAEYLYARMSTKKGGLIGHVNPPDECTEKGKEIYYKNTGREYKADRDAADARLHELNPTAETQFKLLKAFATVSGPTYVKDVKAATCPKIPPKPEFDYDTARSTMQAWSNLLDTYANLASYRTVCQMKDCEHVKDCSADMGWGKWIERDANDKVKCECECVSADKALPRAKHRDWWTRDDNCKWTCDKTKARIGRGQRLDTDICEPVCNITCPPEGDPSKPHVMDKRTYCECGCNLSTSKCRELGMTFNAKLCKCEGLSAKAKWEQKKQRALTDISTEHTRMKELSSRFVPPNQKRSLPGFSAVEENCSPVGMRKYCMALKNDEDYCDERGAEYYEKEWNKIQDLLERENDWDTAREVAAAVVAYRDCLNKLYKKIYALEWDEFYPPEINEEECEDNAPDDAQLPYIDKYFEARDAIRKHVDAASNCNVYAE